jgi:hypothetical protein
MKPRCSPGIGASLFLSRPNYPARIFQTIISYLVLQKKEQRAQWFGQGLSARLSS